MMLGGGMLVAFATYELAMRVRPRVALPLALAVVVAVVAPMVAGLVVVSWLAGWRVRAAARSGDEERGGDLQMLTDLTTLGLGAGLPFPVALAGAAAEVDPGLRSEVRGVLRRARFAGSAAHLGGATGAARELYRVGARAMATGAPVLAAVEAYGAELRRDERARAQVAARRLPVKLLFPLSLLILPGFLLLTVGPSVLGALRRLSI